MTDRDALDDEITEELDDEDEASGQFVTFTVGDECFAFSMQHMREIIRVPETVAIPLTPSALRGLSNLRGTVLPILDLRTMLALPAVQENESTRVLVTDCGRLSGLIVDRVERVIHVNDDQIDHSESVSSSVNEDAIDGVIKGVENYGLIQLLNVSKLLEHEFASMVVQPAGAPSDAAAPSDIEEEDEEDDTSQLVSFTVNNQEYAFEIMQVKEIVRVPDEISSVPKSDQHVLGLMDLRGHLLPMISLRALFGMPAVAMNEETRVLVIALGRKNGCEIAVGVVVDDIREVLRITPDMRDAMPDLLAQGSDSGEIESVCRLDNGKRLISVLNAGALFDNPEIEQALAEVSGQGEQESEEGAMHDAMDDDELDDQDMHLVVFRLQGQEYGVTTDAVQEIIRVPEMEMNAVPKTADFIEGMVNLRGAVLPVMDLRRRFSLQRNERSDQQRILVLEMKGIPTGFIVDEVNEVLRIPKERIENAPHLSDEQSRVMGQVVNMAKEKRMIQILEVAELLDMKEVSILKKAA